MEDILPFIVMTSSAKMPARCKGIYRRVAVVETDGTAYPKIISERARGVVRIVTDYGPCYVGSTERCEYRKALKEARRFADHLNHTRRPLTTLAHEAEARHVAG